jgi:hypothetical protein
MYSSFPRGGPPRPRGPTAGRPGLWGTVPAVSPPRPPAGRPGPRTFDANRGHRGLRGEKRMAAWQEVWFVAANPEARSGGCPWLDPGSWALLAGGA